MVNIKKAVPDASQYGAKLGYTTYEAEQGELKTVLLKMPLLQRQNTQLPVKQAVKHMLICRLMHLFHLLHKQMPMP